MWPLQNRANRINVAVIVPINSEAVDQLKTLDSLDGGLKAYLSEVDSDPKDSTSDIISHPDSTSHGNQNFTPVHFLQISIFPEG